MHTQRQSYLFKNRSRSPQFSQAMQGGKSHQYSTTKIHRSPSVFCFQNVFSLFPVIPPSFLLFFSLTLFLFSPTTVEQINILLVFSSKSSSGQRFFLPPSFPLAESLSLILFHISLLIISSNLNVLSVERIPWHHVSPLHGR